MYNEYKCRTPKCDGYMKRSVDKNEIDGRLRCSKCKTRTTPRVGTIFEGKSFLFIFYLSF